MSIKRQQQWDEERDDQRYRLAHPQLELIEPDENAERSEPQPLANLPPRGYRYIP